MPKIGTHNGKFHCDEVFAIFLLKSLPEYSDYEIVRSRDEDVLSMCNIVVDVGGEYNHAAMKYDHHQRDFSHTMNTLQIMNFGTKLSSAGLIYAHFGKNVIGALLGLSHNDTVIDILFKKVYEIFVEAIDAIDNGIAQFDGEPRYYLGGTLSSRVSMLNPAWNEDLISVDERFIMAVKLVDKEFSELLTYLYKSWLPARSIVVNAVVHRFNVDKSGQIFLLEAGGVPWKDHFFYIEEQFHVKNNGITYVIYEDNANAQWRVQAIPISEKQPFENRLPLPEAWRGLRDAELTKVADIPGCIFVHPTGFIGGNKSLQGVLEMARKSLSLAGKYKN
ncbi:MYG1 protein [Dirofilaria immitis]